jgi:hypothetical protein
VSREFGLPRDEADAQIYQGLLALHRQDYQQARSCFGASLRFYQRSGDNVVTVEGLAGLVASLTGLGQFDRAARLFGAMQSVRETLRGDQDSVLPDEFERYLSGAREQLGEDRFSALQAEGRVMPIEAVLQLSTAITA